MHTFKIGDKVKKKDGTVFSDGNLVNTIRKCPEADEYLLGDVPWVANGWISPDAIELVKELKSLFDWNAKPGEKFIWRGKNSTGIAETIREIPFNNTYISDRGFTMVDNKPYWEKITTNTSSITDNAIISRKAVPEEGSITNTRILDSPDGGPSQYYDFPFHSWVTVNDMVEHLAERQWGKHSWIFKDILKAVTRWGVKKGTDEKYDAKKIIYYGARLLMSVSDKAATRKYLQQLLDDKQFKDF